MDINKQKEKYINDNPMDYVKALEVLNRFPQDDNEKLNNMKFSTLENKEVFLSHASDFNEPFDNRSFYYDIEILKQHKLGYFFGEDFVEENIKNTKLASFSRPGVSNLPMWAHYSNNHQGYCVSYLTEFQKNPELSPTLFPVQYLDGRIDVTKYFEAFLKNIEENYGKAIKEKQKEILIDNLMLLWIIILSCYIKEEKWEYEQEFRVMKPTNVTRAEYMNANPSAIYIGNKCKEEHVFRLINIAFTLNIPVYKLEIISTSLDFQLVPKQIQI